MSRKGSSYDRAKQLILAKHSVSAAEWHVLEIVRLQVPLPPDELAKFLIAYMETSPDTHFTAADYTRAMESLVEKGLLYVLAFADAVSPAPPYSAWDDDVIDGLEGKLDFTPAGYALMEELSSAYEAHYDRPLLRKKPSQ